MDKAITTAILIIIGMMMSLMLFNAAYPAVIEASDAIANMASRTEDQMRTKFVIIHAATEGTNVVLWLKNIGATRITAIELSDLFFGPEGNFGRIPHQSHAAGSFPYWTWQIENAAEWSPTATLKIIIHYGLLPTSGRYFGKLTLPNGVSADYFLGI